MAEAKSNASRLSTVQNNQVLVTGADGFIGRHMVGELVRKGTKLRALDRHFDAPMPQGAEAITADILDAPAVRDAMQGVDTVFHLAAISDLWAPHGSNQHHRVNVEGTQVALNAAIEAGARRFIYCSSNVTLIAGARRSQQIDETCQPARDALFGAYARSKYDAQALVEAAADRIESVIVMPGTPIGPGDHRPTPPGRLLRDLANGAVPALPSHTSVNLTDVRVIAPAIVQTGYIARPGSRYLLTGCDLSFGKLSSIVSDVTGLSMPKAVVPYGVAWAAAFAEDKVWSRVSGAMPTASFDGLRMSGRIRVFSNALARKDLGLAQTDLANTVADALQWMSDQGMIARALPGLAHRRQDAAQ